MLELARDVLEEDSDRGYFELYKEARGSDSRLERLLGEYCRRKTTYEHPDDIIGSREDMDESYPDSGIESAGQVLEPSDD